MGNLPKPNKDLGQHFLKDKKIIQSITDNFSNECDVIVEIGPGPAILTTHLAKHEKPLYVIEKDTRFTELLEGCVKKENIFFEDALKFNWKNFIQEHNLSDKKIWLVSNLPYNISAPLFLSFLKVKEIKFMSLMFQKEVGEKTYIKENTKNQMGSLLALSLNYFNPSHLCKVLPGAFNPPPRVDSVVVSYQRKEDSKITIDNFTSFEKFLRDLFAQKRKQLGSVLKKYTKNKAEIFDQINIERERRAETLTLEEVYKLYENLTTP